MSMSNHTIERSIGREIKRHRTKNGLTIAELAKQSNLSIGMLSKIENGNTSPSLSTLQALSRALLIPITAFSENLKKSGTLATSKPEPAWLLIAVAAEPGTITNF